MIKKIFKPICLIAALLLLSGIMFGCVDEPDENADDIQQGVEQTLYEFKRLSYEEALSEFATGFLPLKPACAVNYVSGGLNADGDYALVIAPAEPADENYIAFVAYPWYFTAPEDYGITAGDLEGLDPSAVSEVGFIDVRGLPAAPIVTEHFASVLPVAFAANTFKTSENEVFNDILSGSVDRDIIFSYFENCGDYALYVKADTERLPIPPYTDAEPELNEFGFKVYYYARANFNSGGIRYSVRFPVYSETVHYSDIDGLHQIEESKKRQIIAIAEKLAAVYVADFYGDPE